MNNIEFTKITDAMPPAYSRLLIKGIVTKYIYHPKDSGNMINLDITFYAIIDWIAYHYRSCNYHFNVNDIIEMTGLDDKKRYTNKELRDNFGFFNSDAQKICRERKLKFRITDIREWAKIETSITSC